MRHKDCPLWDIVTLDRDLMPDSAGKDPGGMAPASGSTWFRWNLKGQEPGPWLKWEGSKVRLINFLRFAVPPGEAEYLAAKAGVAP